MNYGQTCHAGTGIYVHDDVYDQFIEKYTAKMKTLKLGDNFDKGTDQGPMNSKMQFDKILGYLDSGRSEGATIHLGGNAAPISKDGGYFIEPTIFTNATPDMKVGCSSTPLTLRCADKPWIMREEIIGLVFSIG
jgi:aldehyde dehydrogenase (NAD+)